MKSCQNIVFCRKYIAFLNAKTNACNKNWFLFSLFFLFFVSLLEKIFGKGIYFVFRKVSEVERNRLCQKCQFRAKNNTCFTSKHLLAKKAWLIFAKNKRFAKELRNFLKRKRYSVSRFFEVQVKKLPLTNCLYIESSSLLFGIDFYFGILFCRSFEKRMHKNRLKLIKRCVLNSLTKITFALLNKEWIRKRLPNIVL